MYCDSVDDSVEMSWRRMCSALSWKMTSQIPTGDSMSLHFTTPFRDLQHTDVLKSRISIPVLLPADPERPAMFFFTAYFRIISLFDSILRCYPARCEPTPRPRQERLSSSSAHREMIQRQQWLGRRICYYMLDTHTLDKIFGISVNWAVYQQWTRQGNLQRYSGNSIDLRNSSLLFLNAGPMNECPTLPTSEVGPFSLQAC